VVPWRELCALVEPRYPKVRLLPMIAVSAWAKIGGPNADRVHPGRVGDAADQGARDVGAQLNGSTSILGRWHEPWTTLQAILSSPCRNALYERSRACPGTG
jgi:hypothetical protein